MKRHCAVTVALTALMLAGVASSQEPDTPREPAYTEEQISAFLQAQVPEAWQELQATKEREPQMYRQMLNDRKFTLMRYNDLKVSDPQRAADFLRVEKMEAGCQSLARALRQTEDQKTRAELKQKLEQAVREIFDLRLAEREADVKNLERDLSNIRKMLQTRQQAREQIIDRRVRELADERDEATAWW